MGANDDEVSKRYVRKQKAAPVPESAPHKNVETAPSQGIKKIKVKEPKIEPTKIIEVTPPATAQSPTPTANPPEQNSSALENFRNWWIGGSPEDVQKFKNSLPSDDFRKNSVELTFAPTYVNNESRSSSWFRDYGTQTSAAEIDLRFWVSPFLAFYASHLSTLQGSMTTDTQGQNRNTFSDRWISAGFKIRRSYGYAASDPHFTMGLSYYEYQKQLPSDELMRANLKTRGAKFDFESFFPMGPNYHWLIGLEWMPISSNQELKNAREIRSGQKGDASMVGVSVGGQIKAHRSNRLFFKINHRIENDNFTGDSLPNDPIANRSLSGVSVTNTFTIFQIGYIFGF